MFEIVQAATADAIDAIWRQRWGLPICTPTGSWQAKDVEGLRLSRGVQTLGLVTWRVQAKEAEIITLNAFEDDSGHGTRLLEAAEEALEGRGIARLYLFTSNDNLRAVGFYQKRGYRLVKVHLDALNAARKVKPSIPLIGEGGLPLLDSWEFSKDLGRR